MLLWHEINHIFNQFQVDQISEKMKAQREILQSKADEEILTKSTKKADLYKDLTSLLSNISLKVSGMFVIYVQHWHSLLNSNFR